MKTATIRSSWMPGYGYRLDCQPYLGGALETKVLLERLPMRKEPLHTLTAGFDGGIYNGPKFSRTYVETPEYGVPFVGSSSMLYADLSDLPLLSKKQAYSRQLRHLELQPGMTLISCSGTIGKMVYARRDMVGIWSSQHILKVVADPEKIRSGYLYAYLSSKFGVPLVVSGTYGSIIQSLGPNNIADLPVPRLDNALEKEIHDLVDESAELLAQHIEALNTATKLLFTSVNLRNTTRQEWVTQRHHDLGSSVELHGSQSLRPLNFAPRLRRLCEQVQATNWRTLGSLCEGGELSRGGRYSRIDADPEFSYMLISQRGLFALQPEGRWIARDSVSDDVILKPGTIAVAARGTLGEFELYCRAQFIWGRWTEFAYSEDILRIFANDEAIRRGCLFAFLRSHTGFRMLRGVSSGSNMQDNQPFLLSQLPIPIPEQHVQNEINAMVIEAFEKRHKAVANEQKAVALLEAALESSTK